MTGRGAVVSLHTLSPDFKAEGSLVTVTIERTGLDYGMIDAAASEWASIRKLVRHAESLYDDLELLYSIPGPEELRRDRLRRLIETLDHVSGPQPLEMPKAEIFLIWLCVRTLDGEDVPDLDTAAKDALVDRFRALEVHDIFDDDFATPEQLELWRKAGGLTPS